MRRESGITLIALIITIIILVILAAVSVAAVYNMGIVNYAVNGTQNYAQAAVQENQMLDSTTALLDSTVKKIEDIQNKSSVVTFKFTINGIEYTAEEGMTWADWVESDYNTAGLTVSPDYLAVFGENKETVQGVVKSNEIQQGEEYTLKARRKIKELT